MKIKAVIFDLDGTLLDTFGDLHTAMNTAMAAFGYPLPDRARIMESINNGARTFVERCLPLGNHPARRVDEVFEAYKQAYRECYLNETCVYPGIHQLLDRLKKGGIKLAVLSNKRDEMVKKLTEKFFGTEMFGLSLGQTPNLPLKPDPAAALHIAERLGAQAGETLFVGDSDMDIKTAKNAGMPCAAVTWGSRSEAFLREAGAECLIHHPREVLQIVNNEW